MFDGLENFYIGQQVTDNSGNYWGECVSFVKRVAQEKFAVPNADSVLYVRGDLAKNMFLKPNAPSLNYFDLVTPDQLQRGDIVVYGNQYDDSYGDVAIYLGNGRVIGQLGFPVYRPVAIRALGNPLGGLRRKGADMSNYVDADHVDSLAHAYLNDSIANNPGLKEYVGKTYEEVIAVFNGAPERAAFLKHIEDLEKGTLPDTLNIGNVTYKKVK